MVVEPPGERGLHREHDCEAPCTYGQERVSAQRMHGSKATTDISIPPGTKRQQRREHTTLVGVDTEGVYVQDFVMQQESVKHMKEDKEGEHRERQVRCQGHAEIPCR